MKKNIRNLFIAIFFLGISCNGFSQEKAQWGKLTDFDRNFTESEIDPGACGVVLSKIGRVLFYDNTKGATKSITTGGGKSSWAKIGLPPLTIEKYVRIKILKEEGLKYSKVEIPYTSFEKQENIVGLKAQVFTPNSSGKYVRTKVKRKNITDEKINGTQNKISIQFSDVKVGSIIEYRYKIDRKNSNNLSSWNFQSELPTIYSEYKAKISDNVRLKPIYQGERLMAKYGKQARKEWVLSYLPPVKEEAYGVNPNSFRERIFFTLTGYIKKTVTHDIDGSVEFKSVNNTWSDLKNEITNNKKYNSYFESSKLVKNLASQIVGSKINVRKKVELIYNHVSQNYEWDNAFGYKPNCNLKDLIKNKKGNATAKNLLLTSLLQQIDVKAEPILISTKKHGVVNINFPLMVQFNHIVVKAKVYADVMILDAKQSEFTQNYIDTENVCKHALVLNDSKENSFNKNEWVEITPNKETESILKTYYSIENNQLKVLTKVKKSGYEAISERIILAKKSNTEEFIKDKYSVSKIENIKFENEKDINKTLKYSFVTSKEINNINSVEIKPFENFSEKNPFVSSTRFLPIDFGYSFTKEYTTVVKIPEGYKLKETPKQHIMNLPGSQGEVSCTVFATLTEVKIRVELKLNKHKYYKEQYPNIQKVFSFLEKNLDTKIVLEKIAN